MLDKLWRYWPVLVWFAGVLPGALAALLLAYGGASCDPKFGCAGTFQLLLLMVLAGVTLSTVIIILLRKIFIAGQIDSNTSSDMSEKFLLLLLSACFGVLALQAGLWENMAGLGDRFGINEIVAMLVGWTLLCTVVAILAMKARVMIRAR